jgi:ABC-type Mn2+/Zn2+ transport system ATPase subunit
MKPIVQFRNVTLGYGRTVVVHDVSFDIYPAEFFGLVGPNGAGKTTILRAILGGLRPLKGEVLARNINTHPLCFGYVPQRDTIVDILPYTVEEVVLMGRYRRIGLLHRPRPRDREIAQESLAHTEIGDLRNSYFSDLSGGQKQRVLIARALAMQPDVLVLDEPTNGMDLSSRAAILSLIDTLHRVDKLTVIMVSHLLDDVADHVQRLALVERDLFQVDTVDNILTGENLSTLYQRPVSVEHIRGNTIILAGKRHGPT